MNKETLREIIFRILLFFSGVFFWSYATLLLDNDNPKALAIIHKGFIVTAIIMIPPSVWAIYKQFKKQKKGIKTKKAFRII